MLFVQGNISNEQTFDQLVALTKSFLNALLRMCDQIWINYTWWNNYTWGKYKYINIKMYINNFSQKNKKIFIFHIMEINSKQGYASSIYYDICIYIVAII